MFPNVCRGFTLGRLAAAIFSFGFPLYGRASEIKSDEQVLFFPTAAHRGPDGNTWVATIHGWIFEPEEDDLLRRATLAQLCKILRLDPDQPQGTLFEQRVRPFLADNERGKRITVRIGDQAVPLEASARDGHFFGAVELPLPAPESAAEAGRIAFHAVTRHGDSREFRGVAHLLEPTGLSVISDIDDTLKVTEVQDTRKLIANTFLRPFRAVEGMADLYRRWATDGAQFHYVSSSPWQLYEPLAQFLSEAGFPPGTFHLQRFRLKDRSVLNLLADPGFTKPQAIEPLLTAFPGRQFILVGDSAEKDPEVYGRLAREYPRQIRAIFIRDVTGEPADSPRYARAFQGLPVDRWRLVQDATSLPAIDAFR